jgi:acetyltransferase-like isoleucine patch superfamily enzyme
MSIRAREKVTIGRGSFIHPTVHLLGRNSICVGDNVCISADCWLNVNHRIANAVGIGIGNNCFIGKHNFFTSGKGIYLGDYTLTTIGCRFIGSSHIFDDPEVPYLLTGTTNTNVIKVGVNCFFGAGSTVLGNVSVGHGSVIGADAMVTQDIPPFSLVVGNPAKVVKRYSFSRKTWLPVIEITGQDEKDMPDEARYLASLVKSYPRISMPWIAAGKSMGDL